MLQSVHPLSNKSDNETWEEYFSEWNEPYLWDENKKKAYRYIVMCIRYCSVYDRLTLENARDILSISAALALIYKLNYFYLHFYSHLYILTNTKSIF